MSLSSKNHSVVAVDDSTKVESYLEYASASPAILSNSQEMICQGHNLSILVTEQMLSASNICINSGWISSVDASLDSCTLLGESILPELPRVDLLERLGQRIDKVDSSFKEIEEHRNQPVVVIPKANSSVRDSGYSSQHTVCLSTVDSQVSNYRKVLNAYVSKLIFQNISDFVDTNF